MNRTIMAIVFSVGCLPQAAVLSQAPGSFAPMAPATPDETMARFARLDVDGAQLSPDGWKELSALFSSPGPPRTHTRLSIVSDGYGVSKAALMDQRTALVRLTYTHLGFLDVTTGIFETKHSGLHLLEDRKLLLVDRPPAAPVWMIDGDVPDPSIARTAAIRYVTQLVRETKDKKVERNLAIALAALRRQR